MTLEIPVKGDVVPYLAILILAGSKLDELISLLKGHIVFAGSRRRYECFLASRGVFRKPLNEHSSCSGLLNKVPIYASRFALQLCKLLQ